MMMVGSGRSIWLDRINKREREKERERKRRNTMMMRKNN